MQTTFEHPLDGFNQRPGERLQPTDGQIEKWVANLLKDLAADDFPLALFDVAQLQTILRRERRSIAEKSGFPEMFVEYVSAFTPPEETPARSGRTVIYSDDGETAFDLCDGPSPLGECFRARTPNGCVQCAGLWIGGAGWKFKTAEDATACPIAMLGLA